MDACNALDELAVDCDVSQLLTIKQGELKLSMCAQRIIVRNLDQTSINPGTALLDTGASTVPTSSGTKNGQTKVGNMAVCC